MLVPNLLVIPQASMHNELWWHLRWHSMSGKNMAFTRAQRLPQADFLHDFNKLGRIGLRLGFFF